MSEKFPSNNDSQKEQLAAIDFEQVLESHKTACGFATEKLKDHRALHYHNLEHTFGKDGQGLDGGVVGDVRTFLETINLHVSQVVAQDQDMLRRYYVWELGVIAGAAFHDLVMKSVISDEGTLKREGGWEEGKNERESFECLRRYVDEHTTEDNQYASLYKETAESAIKATIPNATSFAPFSPELLEDLDPVVQDILATKDSEGGIMYQGLRLDSQHAKESLAGLLLSTADLAAARSKEIFFVTGNAEFWGSKVPESLLALKFLQTGVIAREDALTLLAQCRAWRQIQVGVALWQRERVKERFSVTVLQELLHNDLHIIVPDDVCHAIAMKVQASLLPGMTESVIDSAQKYQDFLARYAIAESGTDQLDVAETTCLTQALEAMGADAVALEGCLLQQGLNLENK
jgi:hypothetical protein